MRMLGGPQGLDLGADLEAKMCPKTEILGADVGAKMPPERLSKIDPKTSSGGRPSAPHLTGVAAGFPRIPLDKFQPSAHLTGVAAGFPRIPLDRILR